ncbi:hypothetical protein AC579_3074 [Pseudocercospora musae]|uniref:Uncharacterized protein n=1 Tax=Pseudocercospora musae TaxID=113226 RepID=A0A139IJT3_9PEZI|nr:hypothetical protein AC579_3074 [Pseudocercospora musae]
MQSSSIDVVAFDMYDKHVACCYARIVAEVWTLAILWLNLGGEKMELSSRSRSLWEWERKTPMYLFGTKQECSLDQ